MASRDWSELSFTERIFTPIITSVQNLFLNFAPRAILKTIERQIVLAGKQNVWSREKVIFSWGMTIAVAFSAGLIIFFTSNLLLIQRVAILLTLTAIDVMLPASYMRRVILTELPPFLDLLSVSVQAGLSFDASVDRILHRAKGALSDEFRQMQKDMRLGLSKKRSPARNGGQM
ncbi:MAG: type II secretion system F family protein [Selenomonadaceae bacterium]|nr:type II secretion system F family protein [Selenomonadaceae bacterium]